MWLRPSEPFTDIEAELISQRFEVVQRYLELLTERVRRLEATEGGPPPAAGSKVARDSMTALLSYARTGSPQL